MHSTLPRFSRQLLRPAPPTLTPLSPTSTSLVLSLLSLTGPLTTHALHTALHTPLFNASPLPSRKAAKNFLLGTQRNAFLRSEGQGDRQQLRNKGIKAPGTVESSNGVWTITYLKRIVLKEMEEREQVVKITRAKWVKVLDLEREGEVEALGLDRALMKSAEELVKGKEKDDAHVWLPKDLWQKVLERSRTATDAKKGGPEDIEKNRVRERELRAKYGLKEQTV